MKGSLLFLILVGLFFINSCSGPSRPQAKVDIPPIESHDQQGGEEFEVTAKGYGLTREEALRDALLKAIQEAVGFTLTGRTVVSNYLLLDKTSFSRVKGYVRRYELLGESIVQAGIYEVEVKAWVSQSIEEDISELVRMLNKPRIGIVIFDVNGIPNDLAVNTVSKTFTDRGFYVVAPKFPDKWVSPSLDFLTPDRVLSLGEKLDVDMLVYGILKTSDLGDVLGYGLKSSRSVLTLQAYWIGSQQMLTSLSGEVGASDVSQTAAREKSIQQVAEKIATEFVDEIIGKWIEMSGNGITVRFELTGLDYQEYQELKDRLSYIQFVAGVYPRTYEANSRRAVLDVELMGNPEWVIKNLEVSMGIEFNVKEITLTKVVAEVERGW
ncbi:MAG: hypothetical protein PWP37_1238 [Thermotogota bacterium]|nr:hypothetical protein [Thermotogota bacterium]MDK2865046.1 hypothetical protein [Thermotogota bacterium]HCZ06006.1 hypothetical protein [Thermotogota bacterium]